MIITGVSLRHARERAGLTQQEVADAAGVSLRTVSNWERSGNVPRKYWEALVATLPGSGIPITESGHQQLGSGTDADALAAASRKLAAVRDRVRAYAELGMSEVEIVQHHLELVQHIEHGLDGVELANELGVNPALLRDLLDLLLSILLDAGTGAIVTGQTDVDPVRHCLYRIFGLRAILERHMEEGTTGYRPDTRPGGPAQ